MISFEESTLIAIYNDGSREKTITKIKDMQTYLDETETELKELSDTVLVKLEKMSDEEYEEMDLIPAFE